MGSGMLIMLDTLPRPLDNTAGRMPNVALIKTNPELKTETAFAKVSDLCVRHCCYVYISKWSAKDDGHAGTNGNCSFNVYRLKPAIRPQGHQDTLNTSVPHR